jgi:hypothetical protein
MEHQTFLTRRADDFQSPGSFSGAQCGPTAVTPISAKAQLLDLGSDPSSANLSISVGFLSTAGHDSDTVVVLRRQYSNVL